METYNPSGIIVAGHDLFEVEDNRPVVRKRNTGGGIQGLNIIVEGNNCDENRPNTDITYYYSDPISLDWSVSNAVVATLYKLKNECYTCYAGSPYPTFYYNNTIGCYDYQFFPLQLENGAASGYVPDAEGYVYSISAWNYCCGDTEVGCGPPDICFMDGTSYDDRITICEGFENLLGDDLECYPFIRICWSAFYSNSPDSENPGSNSAIIVNGAIYTEDEDPDFAGINGCIEYTNGSNQTERFYVAVVVNDCGIRNQKVLETHCCSRKENLIVELDGLSDFDEFGEWDTLYETLGCFPARGCPEWPNKINTSTRDKGYYLFKTGGLSALNGTYVFPTDCMPAYSPRQVGTVVDSIHGGGSNCFSYLSNLRSCRELVYQNIGSVNFIWEYFKRSEGSVGCRCNKPELYETKTTYTGIMDIFVDPLGIVSSAIHGTIDEYKIVTNCYENFLSSPIECVASDASDSESISVDCQSKDFECGFGLDPDGNLRSRPKCVFGLRINFGSACDQTLEFNAELTQENIFKYFQLLLPNPSNPTQVACQSYNWANAILQPPNQPGAWVYRGYCGVPCQWYDNYIITQLKDDTEFEAYLKVNGATRNYSYRSWYI